MQLHNTVDASKQNEECAETQETQEELELSVHLGPADRAVVSDHVVHEEDGKYHKREDLEDQACQGDVYTSVDSFLGGADGG